MAYNLVQLPPSVSTTRLHGLRALPNGMPAELLASKLYSLETASGRSLEIHPGEWGNWSPSYSPDGRQLAFYSDANGMAQLWVADLASGQCRRVSDARIFVKLFAGDNPAWSPDGSELYVPTALEIQGAAASETSVVPATPTVTVKRTGGVPMSAAEAAGPQPGSMRRSAIQAINAVTGRIRTVVEAPAGLQPYVFRLSPSGQWLAFLSLRSRAEGLYDVSLVRSSGGEVTTLATVEQLLYDGGPGSTDSYGAAYHWSPTQDTLVYVKDRRLWLVDAASGDKQPRALGHELGDIRVQTVKLYDRFDQPAFTADGRSLVARLPGEGTTFAVIPTDGTPRRRVPVARAFVYRDVVRSKASTLWQPEKDRVVVLASDPETGVKSILSVSLVSGESRVLLEERADIKFVGCGGDCRSVIALLESPATLPNLYSLDGAMTARRRLTNANPALESLAAAETTTFTTTVPAYDGTLATVKAALILPPGYQPGLRLPTIVLVYPQAELSRFAGEFGGGRILGALAQLYTTRGYAVLCPDMRPITPVGAPGDLIKELVDLLLPQVYRAAQLGYVDIHRVALMGHSMGGYATAAVISETNLFRAAVAASSVGLDDMTLTSDVVHASHRLGPSGAPGLLWNQFKRYLTNSPYHQADKIRTPLLLVHGTRDSAPVAQAEQMFTALRRLGKTAELLVYEGEPHIIGEWSMVNAVDVTQRVLDFLERHLGPNSPRS